jgi:hypothetical protein
MVTEQALSEKPSTPATESSVAYGHRARSHRRYDMNGRFQMQADKNWLLPKEMNANRFFWDSHWLEIWSNHLFPSISWLPAVSE